MRNVFARSARDGANRFCFQHDGNACATGRDQDAELNLLRTPPADRTNTAIRCPGWPEIPQIPFRMHSETCSERDYPMKKTPVRCCLNVVSFVCGSSQPPKPTFDRSPGLICQEFLTYREVLCRWGRVSFPGSPIEHADSIHGGPVPAMGSRDRTAKPSTSGRLRVAGRRQSNESYPAIPRLIPFSAANRPFALPYRRHAKHVGVVKPTPSECDYSTTSILTNVEAQLLPLTTSVAGGSTQAP